MRCLRWTLVSTAVVMTLSAGFANPSATAGLTQGSGTPAAPGTAASDAAGASPSQQAAAKMTEQDYEAIMKKVGPTYASMRKNLNAGEVANTAKDAPQLAELFGQAEKFWAQYNRQDAVKWARAARTYATEIASAMASVEGFLRLEPRVQQGIQIRLNRANTAATNMGAMCKQCHGTYREGDEATGFRIKPGALGR